MTTDERSVVTIGNFDGVHRGHLALVARATGIAAARGLRSVAVTFDPHPAAVLRPEAVPPALQSVEERVALLRDHGIDEVVVVPFDAALAARSAEAFVTDLLVERLGAEVVVVGDNFRFGAGAAGDVAMLASLGRQHGFDVEAVGLVALEGGPISSSVLRELLAAGDLVAVARDLGRPFTITGEVMHGEGRGRSIGIPTANVAVDPRRALPADGVYVCWASSSVGIGREDTDRVPAVVNIGWRPTFAGTSRTVEAHLLLAGPLLDGPEGADPGGGGPDLYGRPLTLEFVARIRGEQRFEGPDELVARIREDIEAARDILRTP
jgi:riboflavin kinase/FMN adenylyltransferase